MRRRALEAFLYRFDKDPALQAAFVADPVAALAGHGLGDDEVDVMTRRDVVQLWHWQLHPLLIRNFSGTLKVDYLAAYRRAGLDMSQPWPAGEEAARSWNTFSETGNND